MPTSLPPSITAHLLAGLASANARNEHESTGSAIARAPVHVVYGGAHLFQSSTPRRMGELALKLVRDYAPDAVAFAEAMRLDGDARLADDVHARVIAKLEREPVEDYRIDFEDGFGPRSDAEEDREAERTAREVARGMNERSLPPFLGIRVKALGEATKGRSLATLDRFVTTLVRETGGALPNGFVVTLPKITDVAHVETLCGALDALEATNGLAPGSLRLEIMVELPRTLVDAEGTLALPRLVRAAEGRCVAAHFGSYDYTAACGITAAHQRLRHPACDFAKHLMQVSLAGSGVRLSDGATTVLPVPPHRGGPLTDAQRDENRRVVHAAWREAYGNIRHALVSGFPIGWDLHPGQLPVRYAATFAFLLEDLPASGARLKRFLDHAAQAVRSGTTFDDAATGQGLLNTFLRAWSSGAIAADAVAAAGLTVDELETRSFATILERRRRS